MKQIIKPIKIGLGLLPSCLLRFIKKLFVILWLYTYISVIPIAIAFAGKYLIEMITQNSTTAITVFKILATVAQIIPLSFSIYLSECELTETNEGSAELCFAICALVIVALWLK